MAATSPKPLGHRVVVKPKPKEEQTRSGIVLPDTASESACRPALRSGLYAGVGAAGRE